MKLRSLLLPATALGAAALVLVPAPDADGFTTIGGSLSLSQRDFRVFNNFSDAASNNNTTPEPNFPGYTGATLALWKGGAEWGSISHGDGSGDPTQANIGDGGANFDYAFVGEASSIGGTNSNVIGALSGSNGGVLAFMQGPISDGWMIRFYDGSFVWADGPGTINFSQFDLQGVCAHEIGHALGLGHSTVGGTTMFASTGNGSVAQRSIAPDDIAGVQFIYGAMSSSKPTITGLTQASGVVTITGTNFSPTGNEVWFSRQSPTNTGAMVVASGLVSTNGGTEITVTVPSGVGPGQVMVKNSGSGGSALSNSWPFANVDQFPAPFTYCTGKLNSVGFLPQISWTGTPSFSTNNFTLELVHLLPFKNGLAFWGTGQATIPFLNATLCTNPPLARGPIVLSDAFGAASSPQTFSVGDVGTTRNYQWWYRDPAIGDGTGAGLSNAAEVFIAP